MSYQGFANTTKFLTPGTISIGTIRKAQKADSFMTNLFKTNQKSLLKLTMYCSIPPEIAMNID